MPVKIRLARKGASKNGRISIRSPYCAALLCRLKRFGQQINIVVKQLKIIRNLLFASNGGQVHHYLSASFACDGLWGFEIEIRFHQHDLATFPLHQLNEFDSMARSRRNTRSRLDVANHIEAEVL